MPTINTPTVVESSEQVQIILKEFPDVQSGLLVDVYPEGKRAYYTGPLRTASVVYTEDAALRKADDVEFIDEINTWVNTSDTNTLYARVTREAKGYTVDVGERRTEEAEHVLFTAEFTDSELGLQPL